MEQDRLIVVTGDKGGVGKTTIAILIAEWFQHQDIKVELIDADPSRGMQTWIDKCAELGYIINTPGARTRIVDTAGTIGASLTNYIAKADVIVVPFQPHEADLEVVVGWFLSINTRLQDRVLFIPNRLQNTKEQREGLDQISEVLKEEGRGKLLDVGLTNRPAVYAKVHSGRHKNFFDQDLENKVLTEAVKIMTAIAVPSVSKV